MILGEMKKKQRNFLQNKFSFSDENEIKKNKKLELTLMLT